MSANKITSARIHNGARHIGYNGGTTFTYRAIESVSGYARESLDYFNQITSEYQISWSNGSGSVITPGGTLLFTSSGDGGALKQLVIANRGTGDVYFGVNETAIAVASGGTLLATGESMLLDGPITAFWAYARNGNTIVNAMGTRLYNQNMA